MKDICGVEDICGVVFVFGELGEVGCRGSGRGDIAVGRVRLRVDDGGSDHLGAVAGGQSGQVEELVDVTGRDHLCVNEHGHQRHTGHVQHRAGIERECQGSLQHQLGEHQTDAVAGKNRNNRKHNNDCKLTNICM